MTAAKSTITKSESISVMRIRNLACLLFVGLTWCLISATAAAAQAHELIGISAPEIYPNFRGPFAGYVSVTFNNNAQNSDVYYKVDPPSGSAYTPSIRDAKYVGDPVQILGVGEHTVYAVAISRTSGRGDSAVVSRTFLVTSAKVEPPVVTPTSGVYRGAAAIKMDFPPVNSVSAGGLIACAANAVIQYSIDLADPGAMGWMRYAPGTTVDLDAVGQHLLYVRTVVLAPYDPAKANAAAAAGPSAGSAWSPAEVAAAAAGGNASVAVSHRYLITPTLVYDATSECSKCGFKPTAGEPFTITIQGAAVGSTFFLTSSAQGCERQNHLLDDTGVVTIADERVAFHFTTTNDHARVWVCLREPSQREYSALPRRRAAFAYFELQDAIRPLTSIGSTPAPVEVHRQGDAYDQATSGGISSAAVAIVILAVFVVFGVYKASRLLAADGLPMRGGARRVPTNPEAV